MAQTTIQKYDCDRCGFSYKKHILRRQRGLLLCCDCYDNLKKLERPNPRWQSPRDNSTTTTAVNTATVTTVTQETGITSLSDANYDSDIGSYVMHVVGSQPSSLVSEWSFHDMRGRDNVGTNHATTYAVSHADGAFGPRGVFNDTSNHVLIPDAANIRFSAMTSFSITMWVYIVDGQTSGRFFTKGTHYAQIKTGSTGFVSIQFLMDFGAGTDADLRTAEDITTNTLHKIEFIYNSDKSLDIIVDGTMESYGTDVTGSGTMADDTGEDLAIGSWGNGTGGYIGMRAEEVRFYNAARTASDYTYPTMPIVAGTDDDILTLKGTSDTNTVRVEDSSTVALKDNKHMILKNGDNITLVYKSSVWTEVSRNKGGI